MNQHFFSRTCCPVCLDMGGYIIYSSPYNSPLLKTYLDNFYSHQGHIDHKLLDKSVFTLIKCTNCGLIFQKEIPNSELMHTLYEEWIDADIAYQNAKKPTIKNILKKINHLHEIIRIHFALKSIKKAQGKLKLYDFGAGWSEWLSIAKMLGNDVYCSEISASRLMNASKLKIKVIDWNDIEQFRFDFINTEQVFEHIENPRETLQRLTQALAPHGIIKISVPNGEGISEAFNKVPLDYHDLENLNPVAPLEHINCFTHDSLVQLAESEGLCLIKEPKWFIYSLALLTRKIANPSRSISTSTYLFFRKSIR